MKQPCGALSILEAQNFVTTTTRLGVVEPPKFRVSGSSAAQSSIEARACGGTGNDRLSEPRLDSAAPPDGHQSDDGQNDDDDGNDRTHLSLPYCHGAID